MSPSHILLRATLGLALIALVACGGSPSDAGIAPITSAEPNSTAGTLGSRLVDVPVPDDPAVDALSGDSTAAPRVIYLVYADGKALPKTDVDACNGSTAPKFVCNFAPTLEDCQRQIQTYLDKWYADLNVVFTLTRPTSGRYYTEVVSSGGGAWCNVDARVAGVAPFLCKDIYGGVAYTFMGGDNAKQTATIIAQEQAHLVGLEHTNSDNDLMLPTICHNCDGFEDADNTVSGDRCARPTQNSYQLIKERLGPWTGGAKPQVFGCKSDSQGPMVAITEPGDGAMVGSDFSLRVEASDECALTMVSVNVSPQKLSASMSSGPFQWDLTNISGQQTITVTAMDGAGHSSSTSITVTAGVTQSMAAPGDDPTKAHGCSTAGTSPASAAGSIFALALVARRGRRRRR
ncbi:MAG TPA: Ig-like domain-containing protein [Polyangia bacterium]|nr:Ig-like domain-containing protein [Polyangia bacterium]